MGSPGIIADCLSCIKRAVFLHRESRYRVLFTADGAFGHGVDRTDTVEENSYG